jgi:hypothetical protein
MTEESSFFRVTMRLRRSARLSRIGRMKTTLVTAVIALAFMSSTLTKACSEEHEVPKAEIMGGYSYLHSSGTNFNGWKATIVGNVNSWLGIAADFDGFYAGRESEHGITFGPHFSLRKNKKWTPIGFVLVGAAFEKSASGETEHGFATEFGGGLDYELSHRWTIRACDVTGSVTHVGEETHISPKIGVGLILNLGHK